MGHAQSNTQNFSRSYCLFALFYVDNSDAGSNLVIYQAMSDNITLRFPYAGTFKIQVTVSDIHGNNQTFERLYENKLIQYYVSSKTKQLLIIKNEQSSSTESDLMVRSLRLIFGSKCETQTYEWKQNLILEKYDDYVLYDLGFSNNNTFTKHARFMGFKWYQKILNLDSKSFNEACTEAHIQWLQIPDSEVFVQYHSNKTSLTWKNIYELNVTKNFSCGQLTIKYDLGLYHVVSTIGLRIFNDFLRKSQNEKKILASIEKTVSSSLGSAFSNDSDSEPERKLADMSDEKYSLQANNISMKKRCGVSSCTKALRLVYTEDVPEGVCQRLKYFKALQTMRVVIKPIDSIKSQIVLKWPDCKTPYTVQITNRFSNPINTTVNQSYYSFQTLNTLTNYVTIKYEFYHLTGNFSVYDYSDNDAEFTLVDCTTVRISLLFPKAKLIVFNRDELEKFNEYQIEAETTKYNFTLNDAVDGNTYEIHVFYPGRVYKEQNNYLTLYGKRVENNQTTQICLSLASN